MKLVIYRLIDFIVIPQLVSAEQRKTTQSDTISWSLNIFELSDFLR